MSEIICINCSVKRDNAEGIFWAVGNGVYQCSSCREKSRRAGIAFRQDVGFSHQSTDEAVCPHCGYEYSDSWEMRDTALCECPECEVEFTLWVNTSISYTTSKKVL